jgi:DNA-binding transcriptional LysR family regulator
MLNLEHVRTFLTVVERGGFHEAARHLGISQPTVTQHIKKLEADTGRPLIVRSHGKVSATVHGAQFIPFAQTLLRLSQRAKSALDRGGLVVGASSNIGVYMLQPMLKAFAAAHPRIGPIDLRIGSNPETARRLEDSEIDVGLMEWWDDRPGFDARVWCDEPVVVIIPPEHPWACREAIDKEELSTETLIGGEPGTGTARLLQQRLGVTPESLNSGLQLGSTEAVKRAVRAGLGISLTLASAVQDEVRAGVLRALPIRGIPLSKPLYAILSDTQPPVCLARDFGAFLNAGSVAEPPSRA